MFHTVTTSSQLTLTVVTLSGPVFQAEMERALLQGERQAELEQIEAETDVITQLQHKLDELESAIQREKDKVDKGFYLNPLITFKYTESKC